MPSHVEKPIEYAVIGKLSSLGEFRFFKKSNGFFETHAQPQITTDPVPAYEEAISRLCYEVMILTAEKARLVNFLTADELRRISTPRSSFTPRSSLKKDEYCLFAKNSGFNYYYSWHEKGHYTTHEIIHPISLDEALKGFEHLQTTGWHSQVSIIPADCCPTDPSNMSDERIKERSIKRFTGPEQPGTNNGTTIEAERRVRDIADEEIKKVSRVFNDLRLEIQRDVDWAESVKDSVRKQIALAEERTDEAIEKKLSAEQLSYEASKLREARRILDEKINRVDLAIKEECKNACFEIGQAVIVLKTGIRGIVAKIERGSIEPIYYVVVGNYGAGSDAYHESELIDDQDLELVYLQDEEKKRPWWKKLLMIK